MPFLGPSAALPARSRRPVNLGGRGTASASQWPQLVFHLIHPQTVGKFLGAAGKGSWRSKRLSPFSLLPFPVAGSGSLTHKCSSTKHRIISPKVEPRALTLTSVPHPHPPEPPPLITPLPPEVPKAHTSPSSSSSTSSGFAEPLEIRPSPPASRGGSSRGGAAILLLTGLEQRAGGLTPTRHLAPQAGPRPPVSLAVVVGSEPPAPPAPPSPAFDPDRFLNSPQRGQTYGGGQGVSPDFPEAEGAHTPCPALEPAAALEPQAASRGPPPPPGAAGRRENCFFIQDNSGGEELKAQDAAPPAPSPPPPPPSPAPLEPAGRGGRGEALFGGAAGASELEPFGLSSFPDLMGELISDEAPGAPAPAAPLSPALSSITDFSPEWSYPEVSLRPPSPDLPHPRCHLVSLTLATCLSSLSPSLALPPPLPPAG